MININFEKAVIENSEKEIPMLLTIQPKEDKAVKKESRKLNLSICIDVSGSMGMPIIRSSSSFDQRMIMNHSYSTSHGELNKKFGEKPESRLERAKKVAQKLVDNMKNGDMLSLVTFSNDINVVQPSIEITAENKVLLKEKISRMTACGGTNLYDGWLSSVNEVSEKIEKESINRVLVISDGETNNGLTDYDEINKNVSKISENMISTSTFGIGEGFNEDLMISMSMSGCGNSYYIENEQKMDEAFDMEFDNISNIYGTNVKVEIEVFNDGKVVDQLNNYEMTGNKYLLPDIRRRVDIKSIFKIYLPKYEVGERRHIMNINLEYIDDEGKIITIKEKVYSDIISSDDYRYLEFNNEVKIQETLFLLAREREDAKKALNNNDREKAYNILRQAGKTLENCGFTDKRIMSAIHEINASIVNNDENTLRKEISYQSYMTTRSLK